MADQAIVKSSTPYVSKNPDAGFQRFTHTLRHVASVPKVAVEKAIVEEAEQKKQRKEKSK